MKIAAFALLLFCPLRLCAADSDVCRVEVVEKGSGWPIPLVHFRTVDNRVLVTDNAGMITIRSADLLDREVFFHIEGHGYETPKDGFGIRGVRLVPRRGKKLRVELLRTSIAKRIGRLTGAGLFAHSPQKIAETWKESGVVGCDSVQVAAHNGRLFWLWGDTSLPHYPLGIFHSSSATTAIRPLDSPRPPLQIRYDYFRDDRGRPRGVAKMPGKGPTWITGYVSLPNREGTPRLVASYMKVKPPLEAYQWGLCVWNDKQQNFEQLRVIWTKSHETPKPPPLPRGHASIWKDQRGNDHVVFGNPLPTLRCPATFEAWQDESTWETLQPQSTLPTPDDERVKPHSGSIAWNQHRQRWVTVFMQHFGKPSAFGELWYAESKSPFGPWGPAVKVLSHENYTFYNPRVHPELMPADSSVLLFEGTYTQQFANKPQVTPRYDYNQILYSLDLDDQRLRPSHE